MRLVIRFNSILVSITEVCHVGCAHCGFIGSHRDREAAPLDISQWVKDITSYGISTVIFTGGEPFERLDSLSTGVATAHAAGAKVGVFTSSFWAESIPRASEVLFSLPGLTQLYLSSDTFHQRRVPYEFVRNAITAALKLGIEKIIICITFTSAAELQSVRNEYREYEDRVVFHEDRVIPNPYLSIAVLRHQDALVPPVPSKFESSCWLGTPLINPNGDVFSCHIGKAAAHRDLRQTPYFLGNLFEQSFSEIMNRAQTRMDYQFLRTHGPRGVADVVVQHPEMARAAGRDEFTNACDMCFGMLGNPDGKAIFDEHLNSQAVRDDVDMKLVLQLGETPTG